MCFCDIHHSSCVTCTLATTSACSHICIILIERITCRHCKQFNLSDRGCPDSGYTCINIIIKYTLDSVDHCTCPQDYHLTGWSGNKFILLLDDPAKIWLPLRQQVASYSEILSNSKVPLENRKRGLILKSDLKKEEDRVTRRSVFGFEEWRSHRSMTRYLRHFTSFAS